MIRHLDLIDSLLLSHMRGNELLSIDVPIRLIINRNILIPCLPFLVVDHLLLRHRVRGVATFLLNLGQIL